jgi:WD domain, G-beta repeat
MKSSLGAKGSSIASDFAQKRREALARATALRAERHTAAQSHVENEQYMKEFHEALSHQNSAAAGPQGRTTQPVQAARRRSSAQLSASGSARDLGDDLSNSWPYAEPCAGWLQGPVDPAGTLHDASDRNIMCCSLVRNELVLGSADHALYSVEIATGAATRKLHSPSSGHSEWVTCVAHTADGAVLSGCAGGRLCLWPRQSSSSSSRSRSNSSSSSSVRACGQVTAHSNGGVSALRTAASGHAVTCGYGGDLKLWHCAGQQLALACALADASITAPALDCAWRDSSSALLSAHRDGRLAVWDSSTAQLVSTRRAHTGHVTALCSVAASSASDGTAGATTEHCFASGSQDGFVRLWDARCADRGTCLHTLRVKQLLLFIATFIFFMYVCVTSQPA